MKKRKLDLFSIICYIVTTLVVCLIGGIVVVILFRGGVMVPAHLQEKETIFATWLSVKTAFISSLLCFCVAIPTGYVLTHLLIPCRGGVEILLELTMTLPYIVIGLSLLILFSSPAGKLLKEVGFPVVFHQNGIVLAQLVVNLPFAIRLTVTAFQGVDPKLETVAGLLGASRFASFRTILLPLCKNTLISSLILVWSRALGEFGATLMLVGVTRRKTETLPGNIYLNVSTNQIDGALASAFILLLLAAISLFLSRCVTRTDGRKQRYV